MTRSICIVLFALLLLTVSAQANIIGTSSGDVSPDVWNYSSFAPGVTGLADTGTIPFSFDGGQITGTWEEAVVSDLNNSFCTGCLDFVLAFSVNSGSTYDLSAARFGPFGGLTDVGYVTGGGPGTIDPTLVFRGSGNNVGFIFYSNPLGTPANFTFTPGSESEYLITETNSHGYFYSPGNVLQLYDSDGTTSGNNFGAGANFPGIYIPIPEPSSLPLAGTAMLGIGVSYLRRRATQ